MNTKNNNLDDEIMCSCSGTTRGEIQNMLKDGLDIDAISKRTGAFRLCRLRMGCCAVFKSAG